MDDRTYREQPLPEKAEHLRPTAARQGRMTGRVRYILIASITLVVVAFAIIYFLYA